MSLFWIRTLIFGSLYLGIAAWAIPQGFKEINGSRFESLILSNGRVASLQREYLFKREDLLQPGDWILKADGKPFDYRRIKGDFQFMEHGDVVEVEYQRNQKMLKGQLVLREYSNRDVILFFLIPTILSLLFFGFALLTPLQKFNLRKNQESVEVFSILSMILSVYFLLFLPSVSFQIPWSSSILLPLLAVVIFHLFLVYPKKKARAGLRWGFLLSAYSVALAYVTWRSVHWSEVVLWASLAEFAWLGLCVIGAALSLGNTLFSSKDFWARRRARLLSVVFFLGFIAGVSVFISFLWYGPRISLERLLAGALFFPVGFAVVFSKENVFDLERIFRRGIHQVLFLGIAIILALVIGLSWQSWRDLSEADWLLWSAIAMMVALFARPVGVFAESQINRFLMGRVRFPDCDELFESTKSLHEFIEAFCRHCEQHLHIERLEVSCFKDPSLPWKKNNEQHWRYSFGRLERRMHHGLDLEYRSLLRRNRVVIGEVRFSGGDGIAFDPQISKEWDRALTGLARFLELLVLREYVEAQQGLLAVGRMQALLAHEMKNPLAVIQICSGLLKEQVSDHAEGLEILSTIETEVQRITKGLQKIFDHSGKDEEKSVVSLARLMEEIELSLRRRFPKVDIFIEWTPDREDTRDLHLWLQKEAFRQSLLNLAINAAEAGAKRLEMQVIDELPRSVKIMVRDDGPGIPKNLELFKPFVTTKPTGTGLGLSQVKAFMDRHDGRIEVFRGEESGARFLLEFGPELKANEAAELSGERP